MKPHNLEDYREDVQRCMRCGFCRGLCPTWEFLGWESGSPRGRMQIIKSLIDGEIKPNEYIMERIYECALCGYCLWRCPPGVRTTDALKAARAYLVSTGNYLKLLDSIEENLKKGHNIYGLAEDTRVQWTEIMGIADEVPIGEKADIVYFPGCLSSFSGRAMNIAYSTSMILNGLGLEWTLIGNNEWCCGNPLGLSGKIGKMRETVNHNVEAIRRLEPKILVTSCAGCYKTFLQEYPKYIDNLGFQIYHISQLVAEKVDPKSLKFGDKPTAITYHDPCELGRLVGIYDQPRKILKKISGIKFIELPSNRSLTRCCGGGGVLKVTYPEIAIRLASKKLDEAHSVGAEILSTSCPACILNISEAAAERNDEIEILDITEILARSMNLS